MREYYLPGKVEELENADPWLTAKCEHDKKLALLQSRIYEQIDRETILCKLRICEHINNALVKAIP